MNHRLRTLLFGLQLSAFITVTCLCVFPLKAQFGAINSRSQPQLSKGVQKAVESLKKDKASVNYYRNSQEKVIFQVNLYSSTSSKENLSNLLILPNIERIYIGRSFELTPQAWSTLAQISELQHFSVHNSLDDEDLAQVAHLTNIKSLHLSGDNFTNAGTWFLEELTQLRQLTLENCNITDSSFDYLKNMSQLTSLTISSPNNKVKSLHGLGQLRQLDTLTLDFRSADGLVMDEVSKLKKLRSLKLQNLRCKENEISLIGKMPRLEYLTLKDSKFNGEPGLAISKIKPLRSLDISNTNISDADFVHLGKLPNIAYLNLKYTPITDASLKHLYNLKLLRNIDLTGTKVTLSSVKKLKEKFPKLRINSSYSLD